MSVIDQDGNLVSQRQEGFKNDSLNPSQLGYVKEVEAQYLKRVTAILEPLVGKGNFRAQVAAGIDFARIDQVDETYQPTRYRIPPSAASRPPIPARAARLPLAFPAP